MVHRAVNHILSLYVVDSINSALDLCMHCKTTSLSSHAVLFVSYVTLMYGAQFVRLTSAFLMVGGIHLQGKHHRDMARAVSSTRSIGSFSGLKHHWVLLRLKVSGHCS